MKKYNVPTTQVQLISAFARMCSVVSPVPEEQPEGSGQLAPYRY